MDRLRAINKRNWHDAIRLARFPITFVMLEGVKLGPEDLITSEDKRIAMAHARRKEIEQIDEERMLGGRDFPIVGILAGATVLPPFLILALNSVFGWYTDMGPGYHP